MKAGPHRASSPVSNLLESDSLTRPKRRGTPFAHPHGMAFRRAPAAARRAFVSSPSLTVLRRVVLSLALFSLGSCLHASPKTEHLDTRAPKQVLNTLRRSTKLLVEIRTQAGTVVTTPNHLFAKVGSGWTPAGKLAPGDLLVSRAAPEGTPILGTLIRTVPETTVYNLTIDKTHSYLVGSQALLVHNDCSNPRKTLRELLDEDKRTTLRELMERTALEDARKQQENRLKKAEIRARLADARKRREDAKRNFNDAKGPTCNACPLAALGDWGTVQRFMDRHGQGADDLTPREISQLLHDLGLVDLDTPGLKAFPPGESGGRLTKMMEGDLRPVMSEFTKMQRDALEFMGSSSSNTFLVNTTFYDSHGSHTRALVAIRQADGTITFLDPSTKPPEVLNGLDQYTTKVTVTPTNVDWRFNRNLTQLFGGAPIR